MLRVSRGFALNYLTPKSLGIVASPEVVADAAAKKAAAAATRALEIEEASVIAQKLVMLGNVRIMRKITEDGYYGEARTPRALKVFSSRDTARDARLSISRSRVSRETLSRSCPISLSILAYGERRYTFFEPHYFVFKKRRCSQPTCPKCSPPSPAWTSTARSSRSLAPSTPSATTPSRSSCTPRSRSR